MKLLNSTRMRIRRATAPGPQPWRACGGSRICVLEKHANHRDLSECSPY